MSHDKPCLRHLCNAVPPLGKLSHQTEQEERLVVHEFLISVHEAVAGQRAHGDYLVLFGSGHEFAELRKARFGHVGHINLFLAVCGVSENDHRTNLAEFLLLFQFEGFFLDLDLLFQ